MSSNKKPRVLYYSATGGERKYALKKSGGHSKHAKEFLSKNGGSKNLDLIPEEDRAFFEVEDSNKRNLKKFSRKGKT